MKSSKMAKILSAILALAVILCSLPFALGITASAESNTIDYSAMANLSKPSIADYTDTFGMHDGVGLRVKDGALIVDGDWFWQLNAIDKYVDATPAYAIYDVAPNTEFVANFTATTDTSAMKFYVSENMVDWYLAGTAGDEGVVYANIPYYANYLKIVWPLGADANNGLLSVNFVKPEADANNIVINYKKATTGTSTMVGSGLNDANVLNNRGVWQSNGINFNGTGVLAPDWTALNNATSANSFNGYVTYKVQPATRFSMTVTTAKNIDSSWTAFNPFDSTAQKLGYENPADWNIEIYVSADNITFERLDEATLRTMTARYPNNIASHGNAYRSTEYNFIVPEGMAYVKAKFPMTQNLTTVKDADGNAVCGGCGNDIFSINKVEFTRAKYDYRTVVSGDYSVGTAINADTMAAFGMSAYSGISVSAASGIDVAWKQSGTYTAYAQYDVVKGTPFYAGIRIHWPGGLAGYVKEKGSYAIKLQGYNSSTAAWDDVDVLNFDSTYSSSVADFALNMSGEDSIYDKVRVYWNHPVGSSVGGNNLACISEVAFTPKTVYDYTKCKDSATMGNYGIVGGSTGNKVIADKNGKGLVLDYNGVANFSSQGGAGTAYVTYKVEEGSTFKLNFSKNTWYNNDACAEKYNNPDYLIKAYTSADENFTEETLYTATTTDNVNYTIEFTVPAGESNVKVTFPQQGRLSDQWNPGGWFDYVGQDYLYLKSVEITKAALVLDGISVDTEPTNLSFYRGDAFSDDGFVVGLIYTNGEYRRIDSGFELGEVDTSVLGEQEVNFDYGDYSSSYTINVYAYDGDFNCDKKVNMVDLIRLKKIATNEGVSDGADADIDGSGKVDGSDLAQMKKFILGEIAEL